MDDQTNTYNLKAVVMETGLKPVTLRAWERRYGLPEPQRTAGGHRLYSQRDIDMLKWLAARQKEGISISQAVTIWRNMEADGQDPLNTGSPVTGIVTPLVLPEVIGEQLAELRQAWVGYCLDFDETGVDTIMTQAFSRFPMEVVCLEILQKGLATVGTSWYEGDVTVQQEHFASSLAMRHLERLVAAQPPPTRSERILVGCAPKDTHTFSSLLLTFLLRRHGWNVIYLGADVPLQRLDDTIHSTKPDLVIFTAQQLFTAVSLIDIAHAMHKQNIAFAFGGLAFNLLPDLIELIPGYYLGKNLEEVPQKTQMIFVGSLDPAKPAPLSPEYQNAQRQFEQYRGVIESAVWTAFGRKDFPAELLYDINIFFGRDISAALRLGDIGLIATNLEWLQTLIDNYGWPQEWFRYYLQAYYQAAVAHLPDANHALLLWLHEYLSA